MNTELNSTIKRLESKKSSTISGIDVWMGRDLQEILDYSAWEKFEKVIDKAMMACEGAGFEKGKHFHRLVKRVKVGSGVMGKKVDYFLTRYACYLIAMNGSSSKPEIATAQSYFAYQTRMQEKQDKLSEEDRRIYLRERVLDANKNLAGAAKNAGVVRFPIFQDAGYRGLYGGMGLTKIKNHKGLSRSDELLDRAGRTELAANEFRITQTEEKLIRDEINNERDAINTHFDVGEEVRDSIIKIGGDMPENLRPEPSIKKLIRARKKMAKAIKA